MSMKNSNDTIGNRTRDLPTCSAVPQPTEIPRAAEGNTIGLTKSTRKEVLLREVHTVVTVCTRLVMTCVTSRICLSLGNLCASE